MNLRKVIRLASIFRQRGEVLPDVEHDPRSMKRVFPVYLELMKDWAQEEWTGDRELWGGKLQDPVHENLEVWKYLALVKAPPQWSPSSWPTREQAESAEEFLANKGKALGVLGELYKAVGALINDAAKYGISRETAEKYKAKIAGLVGSLGGLIVVKRFLPLLGPIKAALDAWDPAAIAKKKPKMVWHPIDPDEPEDPEEDMPLPPGLGLGRRCPPGTPQRVCDLGYWPVGYDVKQHKIEMEQKKK